MMIRSRRALDRYAANFQHRSVQPSRSDSAPIMRKPLAEPGLTAAQLTRLFARIDFSVSAPGSAEHRQSATIFALSMIVLLLVVVVTSQVYT